MNRITYILLLVILLASCGGNKSEVEPIAVEIPVALSSNADAKELIKDMTDAVNNCRENMAIGAKFVLEQEKSGADSLTAKQGFKAGMFAAKMMFAAKKIEKIRAEAEELKPELSETDWLILETKLDELETSVGDLDPKALGLSEEDMAKMDAEKELRLEEEESVNEVVQAENPEDLESGLALRQLEAEIMQEAQTSNDSQNSNNESSGTFAILFTILVIVLVIIGVILTIRKYLRRMRNAKDTFSQIKNVVKK